MKVELFSNHKEFKDPYLRLVGETDFEKSWLKKNIVDMRLVGRYTTEDYAVFIKEERE